MVKIVGKRVIFKTDSKKQFEDTIERWMKHCGAVMYYYGSYFYDINGDRYDDWDMNTWAVQSTLDEKQRVVQMTVKQVFESDEFWDNISLTVTEIIQRKLLKYTDRVLHFYSEQLQTTEEKTAKFMCELIPANSAMEIGEPVELRDLKVILSADGKLEYEDILSTFKAHFNLISDNGSHIYFFPTVLRLSDNVINVTTIISPSSFTRDVLFHIQGGLAYSSEGLISDTVKYLSRKAEMEAVKSAKAAIMSRNLSHNLGSHVMAYLKNDLRNVRSIFASKVLHELYPDFFKPENPVTKETKDIKDKVELPFLVGLGNFIGYLQERQDYIATIASSYIPSFSPVNFKDSVYDELNPDKRFERHHGSDPNNHNRPQNILLSYIAKSEKLSRIKFGDTNNHDIKLGFKYAGKIFGIDSNESDNETLAEMRRVNFALPGGIVGRQAIFSIVENIIRNAAKHNNVQGDLHLIFETIDGEELKNYPDAFKDSISSASIRELYKNSNHIEDLIILTITDNQVCEEPTIRKLRGALREPYIGPNAQLNKGIKEIRISSAWLRGVDDDDLFALCPMDEKESIPKNRLAPSVVIERSKEGNLRYAIGLRKTYEFALVYGREDDESAKTAFVNEFQLKEDSYKVVCEDVIINSDTCYEYIIAKDSIVFDNIRPRVTNRCINKEMIPECTKVFLKDGSSVFTPESIYHAYTGIDEKSPCIVIDDSKHPKQIIYEEKIKMERDPEERCYMYRSHHFAESEFGAYWVDRWAGVFKGDVACIDSITGDNSSDRLVRREKLDKKWYIGHLYAMQSRVAIFDERLFQIIHGLDESQMTSGRYSTTEYSIKCQKGIWPEKPLTEDEIDNFAINTLHIPSNDNPTLDQFCNLYQACISNLKEVKEISLANRKQMEDLLEPYCFKFKDDVEGYRHLTAAYIEKCVDIYTIIPLGRKECVVVGCSSYEYKCTEVQIQQDGTEKKLPKPAYQFHFEPVAKIGFNEETKNFDVKVKSKPFRYLSIHQGLIDKMYTEFSIKDDDSKSKKDLLHKFYNAFMEGPDIEDTDAFMPRMTIHSGRGHITEKDMPNKQPFLQYSAIEHAVLDCKYSLVELLDFAKYKKS